MRKIVNIKILLIAIFIVNIGSSFAQTDKTIKDIDGNVYNYDTIGTQIWMTENLKTTKLNDGSVIPLITIDSVWANISTPAYCWYNNDKSSYKKDYGALYNWHTVSTGKLCPSGWHVANFKDWEKVFVSEGKFIDGNKLKEKGTTHWMGQDTGGTDEFGFSALPGGLRNDKGIFLNLGTECSLWTIEPGIKGVSSWVWSIESPNIISLGNLSIRNGLSVRCVKDVQNEK